MSIIRTLRSHVCMRLQTQTVRSLADEIGVQFSNLHKFAIGHPQMSSPRLAWIEQVATGLGYRITLEAGEQLGSGKRQRRSIRGKTPSA